MDINSDVVAANTLRLLEAITSMPKKNSDILSFYVVELGQSPAENGSVPKVSQEKSSDDWRAYFDDRSDEEDTEIPRTARSSQLSTHDALHSVESHRIQYSRAWLALLQRIKASPQYSARVLAILHRTVLPHLVDPLKLVDWIGACIEFREFVCVLTRHVSLFLGGSISLLAFNALFVLIQQHNL
jgi:U3 small nucleolar RNA-associated protein 19